MECEAGVQKMVIYVHERRKVIRALDTSARYRVKFSSLYACNRRNILPRTLFGYQFEIELAYWRKSNLRNTTTKRKVSKWIAVFTRLAAKISNSASGDRLSELNWLDSAVQCHCSANVPMPRRALHGCPMPLSARKLWSPIAMIITHTNFYCSFSLSVQKDG